MIISIVDYDKKLYREAIEGFDCNVDTLNVLLKECKSHHCSAKLLMFGNHIGGYCAYRCYSIKIDGDIYPAVEIRGFAIDKRYQGTKIDSKQTVATGFMQEMIAIFKEISENTIRAKYVCLHSIDEPKVLKFYEKVGFQQLQEAQVLEDDFNDRCIPHFMSISSNT